MRDLHVLTDFNDAAGRPLQESLAKLEQIGGAHLDTLFFRDGAENPPYSSEITSRVRFRCR